MSKDRIKIPALGTWIRGLIFLFSLVLVYAGFKVLFVDFWQHLELAFSVELQEELIQQFFIWPWFVVLHFLIVLAVICFCAWWKKGFLNLELFGGKGVIFFGLVALFVDFVFFVLLVGIPLVWNSFFLKLPVQQASETGYGEFTILFTIVVFVGIVFPTILGLAGEFIENKERTA